MPRSLIILMGETIFKLRSPEPCYQGELFTYLESQFQQEVW